MRSKNKPETYVYYLIVAMLGISMLGLPYMKYLAYLLPLIIVLATVLLRCVSFKIDRVLLPHIIILLASLFTAYMYDYNSIKKFLFIFAYTSIFVFVDFSKVKLNLNILGTLLVLIFALQILLGSGVWGVYSGGGEDLTYSLIDSKSSFESTLSFPFALLASYSILKSRWAASFIYIVLAVLSFKRIALLAIAATILSKLLPEKVGKYVYGNVVVTASVMALTFVAIYFSYGGLDDVIVDITNKASNDLSKGRQHLWLAALEGADYSFNDFVLFGVGIGKVLTELQDVYGVERILLHNDILSIYLEFGLIISFAFLVTLTSQKRYSQKVLAVNLIIMFFTDNVMIYQLVMITYFLIQSQLVNNTNQIR